MPERNCAEGLGPTMATVVEVMMLVVRWRVTYDENAGTVRVDVCA